LRRLRSPEIQRSLGNLIAHGFDDFMDFQVMVHAAR
jgi:hypothetical protein